MVVLHSLSYMKNAGFLEDASVLRKRSVIAQAIPTECYVDTKRTPCRRQCPRSELFQVDGIDFDGSVFVRRDFNVKAYTVIYPCAVVRAGRLDLCCGITANAFLTFLFVF